MSFTAHLSAVRPQPLMYKYSICLPKSDYNSRSCSHLSPLVLSALTILSPPSLLSCSCISSLCSLSPLWPHGLVWDVSGLRPALSLRLFLSTDILFYWAKFPPFPTYCVAKVILRWNDWGTEWLTCWHSAGLSTLDDSTRAWLSEWLVSVNKWLGS